MTAIENLVYLSQIDDRDIFVYSHDAIRVLEWLFNNGYEVITWEAFLETKSGIVRTLSFGSKSDSPYRGFGHEIKKIKQEIKLTIEDWSKNRNGSNLIICFNLKDALIRNEKNLSLVLRVAAGLLGLGCIGVLGIFSYILLNEQSIENVGWFGPLSALVCTPIFLYAAFTGKGDLRFFSPENYFKNRTKKRIKTETGHFRWPQNA